MVAILKHPYEVLLQVLRSVSLSSVHRRPIRNVIYCASVCQLRYLTVYRVLFEEVVVFDIFFIVIIIKYGDV